MKRAIYPGIIVLVAILFIMPHFISQNMVLGADALFHYNRFYETAMQIKHHNFSPFISLYGFQQSARVVNAVYGPIFAYFQGLLVLAAGTWFRYQILSNFILYLVSGFSMYGLLRYGKVKRPLATLTAIIFMTTYTVLYWTINQGFTSWGTSLMPLCLLPIVDMSMRHRFPVVKVALSVAVLTQIHMLSAIMLGWIYIPFFISYLIKSDIKKTLWQLVKAIGLYVLLTVNVWASLLMMNLGNHLQFPFVNYHMSDKAINLKGSYWLDYPQILVPLVIVMLLIFIVTHKKIQGFTKQLLGTSLFFLLLSTSLIPWTFLVQHHVPFVSLIQFPFRFFEPFTMLFLFFAASMLEQLMFKRWWHGVMAVICLLSVLGSISTINLRLARWDNISLNKPHTYRMKNVEETKKDFYSKDLQLALEDMQKSSPDYLPTYDSDQKNSYQLYGEQIILNDKNFEKTAKNGELTVTWESKTAGMARLPVIVYRRTQLSQNGQPLKYTDLSEIGSPTVTEKVGKNQLTVKYLVPWYIYLSFAVSVVSWFGCLIFSLREVRRFQKFRK
ncbi:hypothetical protein [Enterococcus sp. AZ103]|uniref:hypothetical protein n=1 Tax=Enterococcus sp. AZ103 TaxID=2774628 RepID=UPI003F22A82F